MTDAFNTTTESSPRRKTRRLTIWIFFLITSAVTTARTAFQLHARVAEKADELPMADELDDPAMLELAIRIGTVLASVLTAVFLLLYLYLCVTVDEKLFPGLMLRIPAVRYIGPTTMIAALSTLPIQLIALGGGIQAPKNSVVVAVWVITVTCFITSLAVRRARRRGARIRQLIVIIGGCVVLAALSYLF